MATFGDLHDENRREDLEETVARLRAAIQYHADAKKSTDYAYLPDQYDFRLWAELDYKRMFPPSRTPNDG